MNVSTLAVLPVCERTHSSFESVGLGYVSPNRIRDDFSTKCYNAKSIICLDTVISGHEMLSTTYLQLSESMTFTSDSSHVRYDDISN